MEAKTLEMIRDMSVGNAKLFLNTIMPTMVLPDTFNVQNLEKYQANRARFRGTFSTTSLKDYAEYVIRRNPQGVAKGFVGADNADKLSCTVYFNIGDTDLAGHCDDQAVLTMKRTAAFEALRQVTNSNHNQRDLSEWMEDWRHYLSTEAADGEPLDLRKSINAVRNITISANSTADHKVGNLSNARSAMEQIEAKSADTLPAFIVLKASPYLGLSSREFVMALSVLTGGDKPVLSLRWVQKEAQLEEISQEFKEVLTAEIGGASILTLGSFSPTN